jgi:hypothetical protein
MKPLSSGGKKRSSQASDGPGVAIVFRCMFVSITVGIIFHLCNAEWGHVICGLYVPELFFENADLVEPIAGIRSTQVFCACLCMRLSVLRRFVGCRCGFGYVYMFVCVFLKMSIFLFWVGSLIKRVAHLLAQSAK